MNTGRRHQLARALTILHDAKVKFELAETLCEEACGIVESIRGEEDESFNGMPESLQQSERGQASEAALNALTEAYDALDGIDVSSGLDEVISNIETAME